MGRSLEFERPRHRLVLVLLALLSGSSGLRGANRAEALSPEV